MNKILLFGGAGNVGRPISRHLREEGHEVVVTDIVGSCPHTDVTSAAAVRATLDRERPDGVVNLAGVVSRIVAEAERERSVSVNVVGAHNVAEACLERGLRLLHVSTSETLQPVNWYAWTKLMGEQAVQYLVREHGLSAVAVRPFMFYDEGEEFGGHRSFMIRVAEALVRGRPIDVHVGTGRSWCHTDDGVAVMRLALLREDLVEESFDIGTSEYIQTEDLARSMADLLGADEGCLRRVPLPTRIHARKLPNLLVQQHVLGYLPRVGIRAGIARVAESVRHRLCA